MTSVQTGAILFCAPGFLLSLWVYVFYGLYVGLAKLHCGAVMVLSYCCSSDKDDVDDKTMGVVSVQTGAV